MKKSLTTLLGSAIVFAAFSGTIDIANSGKSDYTIVTDKDASETVRFVAWDLQRVLAEVTGAKLPLGITGDSSFNGRKFIEVGTRRGIALAGMERVSKLKTNGAIVKSSGDGLALVGADDFGVAIAVYEFLQREVGCRWWTPMDASIPSRPHLAFDSVDFTVETPLECRWLITYQNISSTLRDGNLFLLRNGFNTCGGRVFPNLTLPDGKVGSLPTQVGPATRLVHTFLTFMPPHDHRKYFEKHPEWYAYLKSEKGRVDNRQLCFSNPGLRAEFTKNFLEAVGEKGGWGVYSITQEDYTGPFCDCDDCAKLIAKYDSPGGPLYDFIPEVAAATKAKYPKALIDIIAYHHEQTQRPPRNLSAFPDNVVLTWAPIDDDVSKPADHPNNLASLKDLEDWHRLVSRIWTWYYPLPYPTIQGTPYSGIRRSSRDLRLMVARGMNGAKYEHDVARDAGANFYDMQAWIFGRQFLDPSLDEEALAREFCAGYYKAAADDVWQAWDLMERATAGIAQFEKFSDAPLKAYSKENLEAWTRLFDAAEAKAAGDDTLMQRVREARLGTDLQLLIGHSRYRREGLAGLPTADALHARLASTCRKAFQRRGHADLSKCRDWTVKLLSDIDELHTIASAANLRPPELAEVPEDRITYILPTCIGSGRVRETDKTAVFGFATSITGDLKRGKENFPVNVYDETGKRMLARTVITPEEMTEGAYKLYRVGSFEISERTIVAFGHTWRAQCPLYSHYMPGTRTSYELYVSLKFAGTQYFKGSTKDNAVHFDRAILVKK